MREPLPIYCKTSAAWAKGSRRQTVSAPPASSGPRSGDFPKEDKDAEHQAVLGGVVPFERLLEEPAPARRETARDGTGAEETRFGRYARRLWDGLLAHEKVTDQ